MRLLIVFVLVLSPTLVHAGSETPPEGPPWERDLLEAQAQALKNGAPVFCYFTKTY